MNSTNLTHAEPEEKAHVAIQIVYIVTITVSVKTVQSSSGSLIHSAEEYS